MTLLLSGCSAQDWEKKLRFGWPTGVTRQATEMRVLWTWSGVAALALGVVVWGLIFWSCLRHRKRKGHEDTFIPRQTKYNLLVETIGIIFPFVVIGVLFWRTVVVEDNVNHLSGKQDVTIQVDAFKWNWQFEYLEDSGQPTVYAASDPQSGQNLSTVGSDDEIPVLVIPVNQKILVVEHSYDLIHSFWVPAFLFKRDVIPFYTDRNTNDNKFEFTPTHAGSYVGRCAELCGTYHSQMNFEVRVVTDQQFVTYLGELKRIGSANPARQSLALKQAGIPGGPVATTTIPFHTDRTNHTATVKGG